LAADSEVSVDDLVSREDLLDSEDRAPVIKLVNSLLFEAVRSRASDIHVQPRETYVAVRMRIDGVLFDAHQLPKPIQEEVSTRFKVLGRMNIAEKRLPQDGRATVRVGQRVIDLRIASMPTNHGERIVVRLLDKSARMYTLAELGMDAESFRRFESVIHREHGLILVTGPTGSGKSTTLYSCLQELDTSERNAVTLEDPIEYELEGISQTQINTRKGMTFASGLRSVLRQDPDIIMLGEIRDHETAVMAIQSSLTGHMVFSTLHTNDAPSAVTRLLDLGIEPYLASSSLLAVLAQRLVRRICPHCREAVSVTSAERQAVGLRHDIDTVYRGVGCDHCRGTGYQGRFGVFELLMVTGQIQDSIQRRASAAEIRALGLQEGMRPMRLDGLQKVIEGKTTLDEVTRVTVDVDVET
ncbi:MAG: Flp pilus assembly complex ATPase component TadA, partial [Planctomycetaceae bacterium]|nr:Flp pilus assembly complex ATPase component TadA [Planctomycetaceae bacterium]